VMFIGGFDANGVHVDVVVISATTDAGGRHLKWKNISIGVITTVHCTLIISGGCSI